MLKFVYGVLPAFVIYNDKLVPEKFGGITRCMFIFMKSKYRADDGLLQHELTHVKQFYRTLGFSLIMYALSKNYRFSAEVEAYKAQSEYYKNKELSYNWMVDSLTTKYDLDITKEQALEALRK